MNGKSENSNKMFIDYYKLLNIGYTASNEEIKLAYNKKLHEEPSQSRNLTNNLIYEELEKAYQILIDPDKRFRYNAQLIRNYQRRKSSKFKKIIQKLFKNDRD